MAVPVNAVSLLLGSVAMLCAAFVGYWLGQRQRPPVGPHSAANPPRSDPDPEADPQQLVSTLRALLRRVEPHSALQRDLAEALQMAERQASAVQRLTLDSRSDSLTGLWNRRALDSQLSMLIHAARRYETPLSIAILDLDHFKELNDQHGHPAGDAALGHIADLLRAGTREADFVARYGGDEFVILLPQTELAGALIAAERIRQAIIQRPCRIATREIEMEVSLGIAQLQTEELPGDLLARADAALRHAKQAGRNQIRGAAPP